MIFEYGAQSLEISDDIKIEEQQPVVPVNQRMQMGAETTTPRYWKSDKRTNIYSWFTAHSSLVLLATFHFLLHVESVARL